MLVLRRVFYRAGILKKALSIASTALTFASFGIVRAASNQADANGNALPEAIKTKDPQHVNVFIALVQVPNITLN
jgi:hypothetical protein